MGMGIGCALVYQEAPKTAEELRAAMGRLLRLTHDGPLYQALSAAFRQNGHPDLLPPLKAWTCRRPGGRWLLAGDGLLQGGMDEETALEAARRYGEAFGAPALLGSVCDSDFTQWAYYLPGLRLSAVRLTGRAGGWVDPDSIQRQSAFPEFLLPYLTEEGGDALRRLWTMELTFEEERLEALLDLLGAPGWFDPDRGGPPAGTEWLSAQWEAAP